MIEFNPEKALWFNEPKRHVVTRNRVEITTEPDSDFWQNTYYGFNHDSAHVLSIPTKEKFFTFTVKTEFDSTALFDQCGVVIYINNENWVKTGVEYFNEDISMLGSVVTNIGFSDWATMNTAAAVKTAWYRVSRRESDYYIEYSLDGVDFKQMRMLHLSEGGEEINVGLMACSPRQSSFKAVFTEMAMTECTWGPFEG